MSSRAVRLRLSICLCVVTAASAAGAQELASSIEQLRVLLRPGDTVKVTDTSGREITGSISSLTGSSLALLVKGHPLTLSETEIQTIRQPRHSLSHGARNGFLAGGALGLLSGVAIKADGGSAYFIPFGIGVYGGLGAAIGLGIAATITTDKLIYDSRAKHAPASLSIVKSRDEWCGDAYEVADPGRTVPGCRRIPRSHPASPAAMR